MERFISILKSAGPAKLAAAFAVTALVAAALFAIMFRVGAEERSLLYSDLSAKDAAAVSESLTTANVDFQLSPDGSSIFVPRSKVAEARMRLAADGLPGQGSIGYEIFDKQDALGATSFVQNVNKLRALEGELARSIDSLDTVNAARVHLVLPEKALFQTNSEPPTASIVVGLERGSLSEKQINAIRSLVAAAVQGLSPDKVTILDERGELLAGASIGADASSAAMDDRTSQYEERLRRRLQEIVEGIVGPGGARVQVSADLDFSQVTRTEENFNPDQVAPRSTRTIEEVAADRANDQGVTQAQNVPDGQNPGAAGGQESNSNRTDETVNYEISRSTRTEVITPGKVMRLSVAVAVDGVSTPATKAGEAPKWAARPEAEMQQITALVTSAAGINPERGDKIEVVNVRFAKAASDAGSKAPSAFAFDKNDIMRGAEILAMTLVAAALLFFVARPLVKGVFDSSSGGGGGVPMGLPGQALGMAGAGNVVALPGGDVGTGDERVDIARIQGSVNANAMKQVSEMVKDNPEQTVSVIRAWLQERK
ncbi:MAG: flagellar basal-body MS-ring/collar protein FliF [Hyphomonadaceae bacterium]